MENKNNIYPIFDKMLTRADKEGQGSSAQPAQRDDMVYGAERLR